MSETPAPRGPGRDDDLPGVPAGPGDRPRLGSPGWRLVPQSPDWPAWMDQDAHAEDEDPGDPEEDEDPDNAPPPGLEDAELEALLAGAREITVEQARAAQAWARLGHTAVLAAVGRTCLCNGNPKCRFDHRVKQDPRWKAEQLPNGAVRWTMPSGRQHVTEPTRYPI
jgi:hypothetical protein